MSRDAKLINELRDALVAVTDRLEAYGRAAGSYPTAAKKITDRVIAAARVAIEKATTT